MFEISGEFNTAKVFTDNVDNETKSQLITLLNQKFSRASKIRIMPDCHAGKGCVIGTTMTIPYAVVPNLVGVDIGCGMLVSNLGKKEIDLPSLDKFIRENIPHGFNVNFSHQVNFRDEINSVIATLPKTTEFFNLGIGSLGGGNHFIEVNRNSNGEILLVVHSGSRNFGLQIANFYQKVAINSLKVGGELHRTIQKEIVGKLKREGKQEEISGALEELKKLFNDSIPDDLCYVSGKDFDNYLHDLKIAQEYASLSRRIMADRIIKFLKLELESRFETIHNYIDLENNILRKGSVSAQKGEVLIIPINMRDGSILAKGKGNPDWNFSAPHGAGRLMSRGKAKENLSMEEFKNSMEGIYTTSVKQSTLDEAPMAYKPIEEILENTSDTIEILEVIKPIYNFKA